MSDASQYCPHHSGMVSDIQKIQEVSDLKDIENETALRNLKETMERNQEQNNKRFDKIETSISGIPEKICETIDKRIDEKIDANNSKIYLKLIAAVFSAAVGSVGLFLSILKLIDYLKGLGV